MYQNLIKSSSYFPDISSTLDPLDPSTSHSYNLIYHDDRPISLAIDVRVLRRISCHGRNYSQPYFVKRHQSSDNRSHGFGTKFLLKNCLRVISAMRGNPAQCNKTEKCYRYRLCLLYPVIAVWNVRVSAFDIAVNSAVLLMTC